MKTIIPTLKSLLVLLTITLFLPQLLQAQISGTKIIGSAPSDYLTFTAAVAALNGSGVNGAVVFEVKPGTYNEKISIGAVSGASAVNSITFRSQGLDTSSVTLSYASSGSGTDNYVVFLDGADYVTFQYITIQRTGTSNYAQVIDISNGAMHNSFENCRIMGTSAASTTLFTVLVGSTNLLEDSYTTFFYNTFEGGSYGIYFIGRGSTMLDQGLIISNNIFLDQSFKGIYLMYMESPIIINNEITSNSTNNNFYGIYGQYANNQTRITKNKLALSSGFGIYLTNSECSGIDEMLIANNFISVGGSTTSYGIYCNNLKDANFYYNSINLTGSTAGRAFYMTGATSQDNDLIDNIFANNGGGYAIYVEPTAVNPFTFCDYNDLYTSGSNLAYWKTDGNLSNLAAWQSASTFDANSISVNPGFVSSTDLHITNGALNGAGTASLSSLTPVTDDIDGQIRNLTTPDIGADEISVEDLGVSSFSIDAGYCESTMAEISIYIQNYSAISFSGTVPVFYQYNGGTVVNATTPSLSLAPGDSVLYTFTTQVMVDAAGTIPLISGTLYPEDVDDSNDTLTGSLLVMPLPLADAGDDVYVCIGDSAELIGSGGVSYLWNTIPPQTSAIIHVLVTDTTDFIVTVTGANGCTAMDTATVYPGTYPVPVASFSFAPSDMQVSFTDMSSDAYAWDWDFGDGNTSTQQNPVHIYGANADYEVQLIASNGCHADTITHTVTVLSVDENANQLGLTVSPNPCQNGFSIQYSESVEVLSLKLYDLSGRVVLLTKPDESGYIDVTEIQSGVYILLLETSAGNCEKKLVIQR